jgi:hypothetical protein
MPNGAEQEVRLSLEFACSGCNGSLNVTIQCGGPGLADAEDSVVSTTVPCTHCGLLNQLFFEVNGTVRTVRPCRCFRPMPKPSVN